MAVPVKKHRMTVEEYYRQERAAEFKSDYYDGEIFAMSGGTIRHSQITSNLVREVGIRLKGTPCRTLESNLRLSIQKTGLRCYPDMSVYCGPFEKDPEDSSGETVTNPTVIFEVLSQSTEAYDRGVKSNNYRQIKSLQAYALVSQTNPQVEVFFRQPDNSWLLRDFKESDILSIPAIKLELLLNEIYTDVELSGSDSVAF